MKAKSIQGNTIEEIKLELEKSISDDFIPTLAIVFISIKQDRGVVCKILSDKNIDVFGATSSGEFINGDYTLGATAILLLSMKRSNYHILIEEYVDGGEFNLSKEMGRKAKEIFKKPAFLIASSGFLFDGDIVVRGLEESVGGDASIWGGRAGDDQLGEKTFVFTKEGSSDHGILMLVLDQEKVSLKGQAVSGWKGVGTPKKITKSEGLWIHTLDDQPALDLMIKYMGYKFHGKNKKGPFYDAYVTSPFLLYREKGAPILRSQPFINWEDRSVMMSGGFDKNAKIQLTLPPDFEVVDEVVKSCEEYKEKEIPDADALIMFSCNGRLVELGPMVKDEIQGIKDAVGVPMAGFFSYGEFGRATGGDNESHNYTCCWVALKEN